MKPSFSDELLAVEKAVGNKAQLENSKETLFSNFRRACMDLSKSADCAAQLAASSRSARQAVWILLLEVSKAKLRRKHVLECANVLTTSVNWKTSLSDAAIVSRIAELPEDFQLKLRDGVELSGALNPDNAGTSKTPHSEDSAVESESHGLWTEMKRRKDAENFTRVDPPPTLPEKDRARDSAVVPRKELPETAQSTKPPKQYKATNPFANGAVLFPAPSGLLPLPDVDEWWADAGQGSSKPSEPRIDYQQLFLISKTQEIQQTQQRILRQQEEILKSKSSVGNFSGI